MTENDLIAWYDVNNRIARLEAKYETRNKQIQSIIAFTVIVSPLTFCIWCGLNGFNIETWQVLLKLLGVSTFVLGTFALLIFVMALIWRRW